MKSSVKIWREKEERYKYLGEIGRVVSFTKIHEAPKGFKGPYTIVMVEVGEKRVVGQLVADQIKIGQKVVGVLRRLREPNPKEVIEYGVKWKKL
ncbi:MAG: OB-fold domain-containing protein [Candidatus Beckwithbacteria bacterium]